MTKKINMSGKDLNALATQRAINKNMDSNYIENKHNNELIKMWISQVVPNEPLFCDKQGTMRICHHFLITHYGNEFVNNLPLNIGSRIGTVTRSKNKFLKENPIYDLRPKRKKRDEVTPSLFDVAV